MLGDSTLKARFFTSEFLNSVLTQTDSYSHVLNSNQLQMMKELDMGIAPHAKKRKVETLAPQVSQASVHLKNSMMSLHEVVENFI